MIRSLVLSVVFFFIILYIPYCAKAGVIIEPRYTENQLDWVDPNKEPSNFDGYYISEHGLTCQNQVFQVYQNGMYLPARKCQLPDGAWFAELL
jgi:hypothetical protein